MAKEFLSQRQIPFAEHNVAHDPQAAAEMVRVSGQRGVPVIVVDGEAVVGFDRPRLEGLLAGAKRGVSLGLRVTDAAKVAAQKGLSTASGAYVDRVRPGSPAGEAGAQPGDVVVRINDWEVASVADLKRASSGLGPGQRLSLTVVRGGASQTLQVHT